MRGEFYFIAPQAQFHTALAVFHVAERHFIPKMVKKDNKLANLSIEFSLKVLDSLSAVKGHSSIVNQLERSSTSIGANIHEANYAQSKADFVAKMQIVLKECYESEYWLEIFGRANLLDDGSITGLKNTCGTIRRLLIASINTSKGSV